MASRKPKQTATVTKSMKASTGAGVAKRSYKKVRFHENGLLNVERKTGKYIKIARQNQRDSPLLRLPPELRHLIFRRVIGGKTFEIRKDLPEIGPERSLSQRRLTYFLNQYDHRGIAKNMTVTKNTLALLAVCRQVFAETALLPFSSNTFSAPCADILRMWIKMFPPAVSEAITSIKLNTHIIMLPPEHWLETQPNISQYKRLSSNLPSLKGVQLAVCIAPTRYNRVSKKQKKCGWQFIKGLYEAENSEVKFTKSGRLPLCF